MVNVPNLLDQQETLNTSVTFGWLFLGHRDSCLEPCAPGERATGAGSPRHRGVGDADFRRDLAGIGRERVAGDVAPGASMKTKKNSIGPLGV